MCGAHTTSFVRNAAPSSTAGLIPACHKELMVWMKPAFLTSTEAEGTEGDHGEVGQVADKEVYSVQTVFASVFAALHLLSQFSVGLHSKGHFCLVSLHAQTDGRQYSMFQFAVIQVLAFQLHVLQLLGFTHHI
jgi:hypothetical protein